jgi:hypothetical protein
MEQPLPSRDTAATKANSPIFENAPEHIIIMTPKQAVIFGNKGEKSMGIRSFLGPRLLGESLRWVF